MAPAHLDQTLLQFEETEKFSDDRIAQSSWRLPRSVIAATVVALFLRLTVMYFLLPDRLVARRDHWSMGYETGRIARAIVTGHGFSDPMPNPSGPTAHMGPVFPYIVAGVFRIFGVYSKASAIALLALDGTLAALTCVPIYFLACGSGFGPSAGKVAAWVWALLPSAICLVSQMIWETYLTTLLLACLLLWALYIESSLWEWPAFGFLWGILILTCPNTLVLLPIAGGWACRRLRRDGSRWVGRAIVCGVIAFLVVLPWEVRNYRTFGHLVPVRDNFWLEFRRANNGTPLWCSDNMVHPACNYQEGVEFSTVGEMRYMAHKRQQALEYVSHHPGWFAVQVLRRIVFTWTGFWRTEFVLFDTEKPFDPVCLAITVFMVLGIRRALRDRIAQLKFFLLILLIYPLPYYLMAPELRYRHPIDPIIMILAGYGAEGLRRAWKERGRRRDELEDAEVEALEVEVAG